MDFSKTDKRFNSEGRKYQIQNLWSIHHEIMRLKILGWKNSEIAAHLQVTEVTVSNCTNSELAKRQIEVMTGARDKQTTDVLAEIKAMAPKALKVLDEILSSEEAPGRLQKETAFGVIDYIVPKTLRTENLHAYLTKEDIDDIKRRAKEGGPLMVEEAVEL
jgi:hypothetical protein